MQDGRPRQGARWRRWARLTWRVGANAVSHFNAADGFAMASHVALSTVIALFPFLLFVAALAGFLGSAELAGRVAELLFDTWPHDIAQPIVDQINAVLTRRRGDVLTFGAVLAAFFASNGVEALRVALNRAYRVRERRNFLILRLESLGFVVLGALGMLALALFVVLAPVVWEIAVRTAPWLQPFERLFLVGRVGTAALVLAIVLIIAHRFLPDCRLGLRAIWPGVLMTLVLWLAGGAAFAAYIRDFSRYAYVTTYAGLAGIMIALVFLVLLAAILILGAELNAAILQVKEDLKEERDVLD